MLTNNNSILLIITVVSLLCVPSCIDPIDFSEGSDTGNLVVDGWITDEPGPYVVYLARTSEYNSVSYLTDNVQGAIVLISDDIGNSEMLIESYFPGEYKTDPEGIQGILGRYYKIEIKTPDGKKYESKPELLRAVPIIDSVYYERQQYQELDENQNLQTLEGFQIFLNTSDPENDKNYYMWTWMGTHEVHTQPWDYVVWQSGFAQPAPKDCCSTCWITERSGLIDVMDDAYLGGSQIFKKPITFVSILTSYGTRHFRGKYHVEVKQLSLTREAYHYWSSIKEQISSSGSIFEPPPAAIAGNIYAINNPYEPVFGYFGASSISAKGVFIPENEAPYSLGDTLDWPDDCRLLGNSTAIKPSFW